MNMVDGTPAISTSSTGTPQVSGWAACVNEASTLTEVAILIDKHPVAATKTGLPRPDVAKAFGRADFEKSGWKALIPVAGVTVGTHELTAQVTCSGGEKGLLPPFRLLVSGS